MATYTIYERSSRPCAVKFVAGDFWNTTENFSLTVENISEKAIQSFALESEHFLSPQYLHRPFEGRSWTGGSDRWTGSTTDAETQVVSFDYGAEFAGLGIFPRVGNIY